MKKELSALRHRIDGISAGVRGAVAVVGFNPNSLKPDESQGYREAFDGAAERILRNVDENDSASASAMLADIRQWIGESITATDTILMSSVPILPLAVEPLKEIEAECRKLLPEVADYLKARVEWLSAQGFPRTWDEMKEVRRRTEW